MTSAVTPSPKVVQLGAKKDLPQPVIYPVKEKEGM